MKTTHSLEAIKWHLANNIFPRLQDSTIEKILRTCDKVNKGTLTLDSWIFPMKHNSIAKHNVTVGDMFEDLKIEVAEEN